jgi:uncharacterized membrane protein
MSQNILKELPELIKGGIISNETADRISKYYQQKKESSPNKLLLIFGILGALLTGLGIILIIAHNWDNLGRITKTLLAFIPILIGQAACIYTLVKKNSNLAWRESSGTFLFFAIGAVIALVSQIYNIPGKTSTFLLTWMLLSFPLIYLMRSSFVSLLYLIGITYYAVEAEYSFFNNQNNYYILLFLIAIPYYVNLYKSAKQSNFFTFHTWLIAISILISMGTYSLENEDYMVLAYFSLLGAYYLLGKSIFFKDLKPINNAFLLIGGLGMIIMLLVLSFDFYWDQLVKTEFILKEVITSAEFIIAVIVTIASISLLVYNKRSQGWGSIDINEFLFIVFVFLFFSGFQFSIPVLIMINLIILASGLYYIIKGVKNQHLMVMNYGLLIITTLIICRFLDTDLSFVFRGILFVGIGMAFFLTNFMILKKKKMQAPGNVDNSEKEPAS